jgi:hypothetical protein
MLNNEEMYRQIKYPLTNDNKLVFKKYQYGDHNYINMCEYRQLRNGWYPTKKALSFSENYLLQFCEELQKVRQVQRQIYERRLNVIHSNNSKVLNDFDIIIKKVVNRIYIEKINNSAEENNNILFILPNTRRLVKHLLERLQVR